jgi:hypothetical protein
VKNEVFEEYDRGHGRVEKRTVRLCHDLNWLTTSERWSNLEFVVEVMRACEELATGENIAGKPA